jgi:hypothetical protein
MNTLQTIYNKLQDKTELASYKIDLGIVQDISKATATYKDIPNFLNNSNVALIKFDKEYRQSLKDFTSIKDSAQTNLSKYKDSYDTTGMLLNKTKDAAQNLGLNVNDIPSFKELETLHTNLVKSYTSLKTTFDKVNK